MNARPLAHITRLDELCEAFYTFLRGEIEAGRNELATLKSYELQLRKWRELLPADVKIEDLRRFDLTGKGGAKRHRIHAVKHLFKWADEQQITEGNPFAKVPLPRGGRRERTLKANESAKLLLACDPRTTRQRNFGRRGAHSPQRPLRMVIFAMSRTLLRPQEIRALRWEDFEDIAENLGQITLNKFKGKKRRTDGLRERVVPIACPSLLRILRRWRERRKPAAEDFIFLQHNGRGWKKNWLCCAVRRARIRAGIKAKNGEEVVAYTNRHTGVTRAFEQGATSSQIAKVVGHANPKMTEWYNHTESSEMVEVIEKAMRRKKAKFLLS